MATHDQHMFKSDILKRVNNHKSSPSVKTCNTICSRSLNISNNIISSTHLKDSPISLVGGFNPLKKILVSWDDYSQYIYMGKIKNVPNHQPVIGFINHYQPLLTTLNHYQPLLTTIKPAIKLMFNWCSTDPINSKLYDSIASDRAPSRWHLHPCLVLRQKRHQDLWQFIAATWPNEAMAGQLQCLFVYRIYICIVSTT